MAREFTSRMVRLKEFEKMTPKAAPGKFLHFFSQTSNHFSLAVFSAITLGKLARWVWPVAIAWAAMVSFAQVYVGVHFPLDVTCGAMLGITVGLITGKFFNRYFGLADPSIAISGQLPK